jgi:hypothetical protein
MEINGKEITQEMMEKVASCKTVDELLALAKENGIEISTEQAETYLAEHVVNLLDNEKLDAVAGGQMSSPKRDEVKTMDQNRRICFLTTAVCEYHGKPDDCEELTTLRAYRDNWLSKQPGGNALIEEYYAIAPSIVRAMKDSPNYGEICEELLTNYIRPCLDLISMGKNEECKELYIQMVRYAQSLVRVAA